MKKAKVFIALVVIFMTINTQAFAQMWHWSDPSWDHDGWHYMNWPTTTVEIELQGTISVDSIMFMPHYYLDVDNDQTLDYQLGFGPYWYEPASGALWPQTGDDVTLKGWLQEYGVLPFVVVSEINGLVWRDSTGVPPWSGGWIHRNSPNNEFVYCPTDSLSWLNFVPGCMMGMMGMMFPDSIFAQFEILHPDSLPALFDSTCFVGFHLNILDDNLNPMMGGRQGRWGGMMMGFRLGIGHNFHFSNDMLALRGINNPQEISLRYYDSQNGWRPVSNYKVDYQKNTVSFSSTNTQSYYALSAISGQTDAKDKSAARQQPNSYSLYQNFPNPFNPQTTIRFDLPKGERVKLTVYNTFGHQVAKLIDGYKQAGTHEVVFNANRLASGIYYYKIETGNLTFSKKMVLVR